MRAEVKERLKRLGSGLAIPGYIALVWSLFGSWSRVEFILRKLGDFLAWEYAKVALFLLSLAWLTYLLLRPETAEGAAERRLKTVKRLLREAAAEFRAAERDVSDFDSVTEGATNHMKILFFLDQAFNHRIKHDYLLFSKEEGDKWRETGQDFPVDAATADYLERLADRITVDDLDFGFVLPQDYEQYRKANNWERNRRPIPSDAV